MTKERKIEILKDLLVQLSDSANILCTCEADERCEVVEECIKALEQPTRKVGKWIAIDDTHSQCMECGAIFCISSSNEWEINYCPNCGADMRGSEMDRQQARKILKNTGYIGNEVGVAFDVAIKSMEKLEKIEQIVNKYDGSVPSIILQFSEIQELLEKE